MFFAPAQEAEPPARAFNSKVQIMEILEIFLALPLVLYLPMFPARVLPELLRYTAATNSCARSRQLRRNSRAAAEQRF